MYCFMFFGILQGFISFCIFYLMTQKFETKQVFYSVGPTHKTAKIFLKKL